MMGLTERYGQFACLCVACLPTRLARRRAKAGKLDLPVEALVQTGVTIRKNLPACQSRYLPAQQAGGACREALGYGE